MMIRRSGTWRPAILLAMALATVASCSSGGGSKGTPTTPGPGGGGGGTSAELNSGDLAPGATFAHRFATAGTFNYHCIFHAPMTGSVVVSAAAADTLVNVSIVSSTVPFPGATVRPGGRVVWANNTAMVHTVTSN